MGHCTTCWLMGKLKDGDSIVTSGLNTEAYNGLQGMVISGLNENGRHDVQLRLADGSIKELAIKPENLRRANEDASAQARVQKSEQNGAEEQPPPFYDENLAPEYQDSMVFKEPWKGVLHNVYKGDDCDVGVLFNHQPIDEIQFRHLHFGVIHADLPWLVAILRRGAVIDAPSKKGTPLHLLCSSIRVMGEFTNRNDSALPRSRVAILKFLLSVGADPNVVLLHDDLQAAGSRHSRRRTARGGRGQETAIDMSTIPSGMQASPMHEAALMTSDELATRIFDLLLQHKADPTLRNRSGKTALDILQSRGRAALHAAVQEMIERYKNTSRPARLCPCNSGTLLEDCHGAKHGVPIHPRMICPCERKRTKGQVYGKCCKKRGFPMRETLDTILQETTIRDKPAVEMIGKYMDGMKQAAAEAGVDVESEEFENSPLFPSMDGDGGLEEHNAQVRAMNMELIQPLVEEGKVDPAYLFAANKCDFFNAKPWRKNNVVALSKGEMEKRQREWNALVDEYIVGAAARGDLRPASEIEKAAKVGWTGGPMYAFCGNPACGEQESGDIKFQLCSKCKQAKFCSGRCLTAAWKPHHKAVCGTDAAEPRLPSEVAFSQAYTAHLGGLSALMGGVSGLGI